MQRSTLDLLSAFELGIYSNVQGSHVIEIEKLRNMIQFKINALLARDVRRKFKLGVFNGERPYLVRSCIPR
jgi:hypothetical protein